MATTSKASPAWPVQGELGAPVAAAELPRLTDPAIACQLNREIEAMKADPALARKFLVGLGIITPETGKLTRRFGG